MSLFHVGFSQHSGDVGEKEVEKDKVDKGQTGESTSDIRVAGSKEKYEEKRKMLGHGFHKEWKEEYKSI